MAQGSLQAIVIAAGRSTRFGTSKTKLSFRLCGQELITFPLGLLKELNIDTTLILGYQKELLIPIIERFMPTAQHIEQREQKGTGHAVLISRDTWHADNILILNGDLPLLHKEDLENLIIRHKETEATISCIAAYTIDPSITGYGRFIIKEGQLSIVEQRDFNGDPSEHCRLNAGIYLFKRSFLERALPQLSPHPTHGELYITDLIKQASMEGERIELVDVPFDRARGVNTLRELWIAEHIKKSELLMKFLNEGVRFTAPESVSIDMGVTIGADSSIGYGVQLRSGTHIGNNVFVDAFSVLDNSIIEDHTIINSHSVVSNSHIKKSAVVGPFAHIHNQSTVGSKSAIGNFVEVTKSSLGEKTKAKHLTYLGNARIGAGVNIGAGAVTCNYNGVTKHITTIEDNAFIGTNVSLIAPISIGERAVIGAGSTITKDVPSEALALGRAAQITKEKYAPLLKERYRAAVRPLPEETL